MSKLTNNPKLCTLKQLYWLNQVTTALAVPARILFFYKTQRSIRLKKITGISIALGGGWGVTYPTKPSRVGFCREKNSKNFGRDGKSCGHLVQSVQLFESTQFRDCWSTFICYISWLVFFNLRDHSYPRV
jgi:hypothetical protein